MTNSWDMLCPISCRSSAAPFQGFVSLDAPWVPRPRWCPASTPTRASSCSSTTTSPPTCSTSTRTATSSPFRHQETQDGRMHLDNVILMQVLIYHKFSTTTFIVLNKSDSLTICILLDFTVWGPVTFFSAEPRRHWHSQQEVTVEKQFGTAKH